MLCFYVGVQKKKEGYWGVVLRDKITCQGGDSCQTSINVRRSVGGGGGCYMECFKATWTRGMNILIYKLQHNWRHWTLDAWYNFANQKHNKICPFYVIVTKMAFFRGRVWIFPCPCPPSPPDNFFLSEFFLDIRKNRLVFLFHRLKCFNYT